MNQIIKPFDRMIIFSIESINFTKIVRYSSNEVAPVKNKNLQEIGDFSDISGPPDKNRTCV